MSAGQIKSGKPILFATQPSPSPDASAVAVPYVGSYLAVQYDHEGKVQYYYFFKSPQTQSGPIVGREPISVAELKRLYEDAKSSERRYVALKAIDNGVIRISDGPCFDS